MAGILFIAAILELVGGILVFMEAQSAIHQILGQLAIGFSLLTFGMASLVETAQRIRRKLDHHVDRTWRDDKLADGVAAELSRPGAQEWRWPWSAPPKKRKRTTARLEPR